MALRSLTQTLTLGALAMAGGCVLAGDAVNTDKAPVAQPQIKTEARPTTASAETTSTTTRTVEAEETPVPCSTLIGGMRGPTGVLKPVRTVPNKMGMIIM